MRPLLREPAYFVMAALASGPSHGYAIVAIARELSGGNVRVPVATVYATLDRLAQDGLIVQSDTVVVDGRARRVFALTEEGSNLLSAESQRLAEAAAEVQRRLGESARSAVKPARPPVRDPKRKAAPA
jgi:PadR family transcriptional regulator, regulatory protein PadR